MATAVTEIHAFDAARKAGREPFKVKDLGAGRVRPQGDPPRRARDARPDGAAQALRRRRSRSPAPHHGLAAHDRADRRADRDADRARRRRALGELQHLLDAGHAPRRRSPSAVPKPAAPPPTRSGTPVFAWKGETLDEYWWCTVEALMWPDGSGPTHDRRRRRRRDAVRAQGARVREGRQGPGVQPRQGSGRVGRHSRDAAQGAEGASRRVVEDRPRHQGRQRRDDHRRAPPLRDDRGEHAAVPGDQRQRLGDQEQVRQPLRLPPLADRRPEPRQRRDARRQGRGGVRLRRRRQGLRPGAQGPGLPRDRHRDRSDLRAAGGDGRLPGDDDRGRDRDRRHLHHRDRQQEHHHRRP